MKPVKVVLLTLLIAATIVAMIVATLVHRGFRATSEPSKPERIVARGIRNFSIPRAARRERSPLKASSADLQAGRDLFLTQCSNCHGVDAKGKTPVGSNLYPRVPDLHSPETQSLSDGEIHDIIQNGVQLTGMPAWGTAHQPPEKIWQLVLYVRSLRQLSGSEKTEQASLTSAHYVGSAACEKCHQDIYARWKKTPMANIVRTLKDHPEAIIPDLATNTVAPFTRDQV
ncbi:MAG TPA: c-type cytochrome, partial [Terriglobales bacterium]|nr:c-type cytochrome [Terriglobales bacterium]